MRELSKKETAVLESLQKTIKVRRMKGKEPVAIGMVGLVGSGKTIVAEMLAKKLGAEVISGDMVRIALRKRKIEYDNIREIMLALVVHVLESSGSVVIDSDFADAGKRNDLKKRVKDAGGRLYFVRTIRDSDTLIGDIVMARHGGTNTDLFASANTSWRGQKKPNVVKMREMWRRTPHHYSWSKDEGGQWIQKTIPDIYTAIDTTKKSSISKQVSGIAKQLR